MYLHRQMLHLPVPLNPKELVGGMTIAVLNPKSRQPHHVGAAAAAVALAAHSDDDGTAATGRGKLMMNFTNKSSSYFEKSIFYYKLDVLSHVLIISHI